MGESQEAVDQQRVGRVIGYENYITQTNLQTGYNDRGNMPKSTMQNGDESDDDNCWEFKCAFSEFGDAASSPRPKGLLTVKPDKIINLLVNEAEGLKFLIIDGIDVASDSVIYFTDASYKYNLERHMLDVLAGRPHGRLMSFDPSTNQTTVLLRDLYFANGVALSPDQHSLVYCETLLRRCKRYHIQGDKKGTVEKFIENLLGFLDNIRYDA